VCDTLRYATINGAEMSRFEKDAYLRWARKIADPQIADPRSIAPVADPLGSAGFPFLESART
jgi:hypothetical protein